MWLLPSQLSASVAAAEGSTWDSTPRSPEEFGSRVTWRGETFREFSPSPTSSEKPTQLPVFSRAWRSTAWLRLLCGRTCSPSTELRFVAWWTSCLAALRAKTLALPESEPGSTESAAGSSGNSSTLPMPSTPPASFGRTSEEQGSLFHASSVLSSRAATGARPSRFALLTWEPRTSAPASSSWPTATDAARMWPTATAERSGSNRGGGMGKVGEYRPSLETAAKQWPTPKASEPTRADCPSEQARNSPSLRSVAENWQTPWASNGAKSGPNQSQGGKPALAAQANGLRGLETSAPGKPSSSNGQTSRRLNPAFVEWLMGWPEGWSLAGLTGSDSWATASSPPKRQRRLSSLRHNSDET